MLDDADYAGYRIKWRINKCCWDMFLIKHTFNISNLKNKT